MVGSSLGVCVLWPGHVVSQARVSRRDEAGEKVMPTVMLSRF